MDMKADEQEIKLILRQIADVLLINGGFLNNPGLYTGEMGLVLFFARYARFTQNDLYMDYAFGLVEKIQRRIHQDTPINYKNGLTGIGSAIEYLVQNSFFEADTDEILDDFDRLIYFTYNIPYLPIEDMIDIRYYIHWRLSGNSMQKEKIQRFILPQIEKVMRDKSVNPALILPNLKTKPAGFDEKTSVHCQEFIAKNNFWNEDLGLQDGLAGWGLSLLTEIDGDDTWFQLLPVNSKETHPCKPLTVNH